VLPYFFAYLHFASFASLRSSLYLSLVLFAILCIALSLLIGLRYEVGADWYICLDNQEELIGVSLSDLSLVRDPAYTLLDWVLVNSNLSVYDVNLIYVFTLSFGLLLFCNNQLHLG